MENTKTRSRENTLDIYNNSIKKLGNTFALDGNKLNRFYVKKQYTCWVNDIPDYNEDYMSFESRHVILSDNVESIKYQNVYSGLKLLGETPEDDHNFISEIKVVFNLTSYVVIFGKEQIAKLYHEQLTDAEIDKIVKSEMKRHTEFIDAKIKEIENKNL